MMSLMSPSSEAPNIWIIAGPLSEVKEEVLTQMSATHPLCNYKKKMGMMNRKFKRVVYLRKLKLM